MEWVRGALIPGCRLAVTGLVEVWRRFPVHGERPSLHLGAVITQVREAVRLALAGFVGHLVHSAQSVVLAGQIAVLPFSAHGSFLLVSVGDRHHATG